MKNVHVCSRILKLHEMISYIIKSKVLIPKRGYAMGKLVEGETKKPNIFQVHRKKFQRAWYAFKSKPEYAINAKEVTQNRKLYFYTAVVLVVSIANWIYTLGVEEDE